MRIRSPIEGGGARRLPRRRPSGHDHVASLAAVLKPGKRRDEDGERAGPGRDAGRFSAVGAWRFKHGR